MLLLGGNGLHTFVSDKRDMLLDNLDARGSLGPAQRGNVLRDCDGTPAQGKGALFFFWLVEVDGFNTLCLNV